MVIHPEAFVVMPFADLSVPSAPSVRAAVGAAVFGAAVYGASHVICGGRRVHVKFLLEVSKIF